MSAQHVEEDIDKCLVVFCDEFERQVKDLADGIKQDNPNTDPVAAKLEALIIVTAGSIYGIKDGLQRVRKLLLDADE